MVGTTISHYRILEKLGEGGMGVVYKAQDLLLERSVALKLMSKAMTDGAFRTGLLREAKLAASLNHPNIAHVYEAGEADGVWYIAMEFVEGQTLRQKIASKTPLPELVGDLLQVANALQHAHSRGVIHCDLKPANIIVTQDGIPKVLDFGLARLVRTNRREDPRCFTDAQTQTITGFRSGELIQGTPGYMSPEQAEGKEPLTASTDIFSFGCIVFEATTHRIPFWDTNPIRAMHKLLYDPTPKLSEFLDPAPAALQEVLTVCLAKDPIERGTSLAGVRDHLQRFLQAPESPQPPVTKQVDRNSLSGVRSRRNTWILGSLLVLTLVACAALVSYLGSGSTTSPQSSLSEITSIAVLPFTNGNATREITFISDGLSEGLIDALGKLPNLKVVARTSSFQFKGEQSDTRHIAQTLGVRALIAGRVSEWDGELQADVQLLNGKDGAILWQHQYDATADDLNKVEEQIVRAVSKLIGSRQKPTIEPPASESSGVVPEAYSLLLRGRYEMRLYNPQSTQKAVDYYREALAVNPGFALANAELANSYRLLSGAGILPPSEAMPLAEAAALRAIGKDGQLAQAHAVLADIRRDQWDWSAAESEYMRALHLNPNLVSAHTGLAIYLSLFGRVDGAIAEASKARDLDPIGVPTSIDAAAVYYNCRKYDEALRELRRALSLDPSASALWTWIGIINGGSGRYAQAIDAYEKALRLGDKTAATGCSYGYSLAKAGRQREARDILKQLQASKEYLPLTALAILFVGLGENDHALDLLEQALSSRDQLLQYLGVESHFDALHSSPRFRKLLAKLGLPVWTQ